MFVSISTYIQEKMSTYEEMFDNFIYGVKMFFCWNIPIRYPDPRAAQYGKLCWKIYEFPFLQYAICLIQTVISFYPQTVWGPNGVFIFNTVVLGFLTFYLALRFTWITEKHKEITDCDVFAVQTVVFMITVSYVYHEFLKIQ